MTVDQHTPGTGLQPLLHDLVVAVAAPSVVLSGPDGDVDAGTAPVQGWFHSDVRLLHRAVLTVGGARPTPVLGRSTGGGAAVFVGLARDLGDRVPDPTVRVDRQRRLAPGAWHERVVVRSTATVTVEADVVLEVACDLAGLEAVKTGLRPPAPVAARSPRPGTLRFGDDVEVHVPGATADVVTGRLTRSVRLAPGEQVELDWAATVPEPEPATGTAAGDDATLMLAAPVAPTWSVPVVEADDRRLADLLTASLADLHGLRLAGADAPDDVFLAAGAPWFFTLFGRDSLWAARFLLPLGTDLARGTLRTLARRQGLRVDPATEEEPGRILHEVRRGGLDLGEGLRLPPVYFGTVDATPLWICLLHDAWRWGMAREDVEALLPAAEAALAWLDASVSADERGFVAYVDRTGHGLANQGWKDSGDSIRFSDGRIADAPVSLAEVQGYAHEAAIAGAALLDAFGRPGGDRWRAWADALAQRFRAAFWVHDEAGRFPALALDRDGRPVDTLTSNAGHLLGTGILDADESADVAARMVSPDLAAGFGLRTMSAAATAFAPLSYHCGSVWPHDTAVVLLGLARAGFADLAAPLVDGLLSAGTAFGGRLPELYGGDARAQWPAPTPYPAACRPQAWSAASSVALVSTLLGLDPDVPGGRLALSPAAHSPVGALAVSGLRLAGEPLSVSVDASGAVLGVTAPAAVRSGVLERHPAGS